jgi:hypothetical protein
MVLRFFFVKILGMIKYPNRLTLSSIPLPRASISHSRKLLSCLHSPKTSTYSYQFRPINRIRISSTLINGWQHHEETDQWSYIWGNTLFSTSKVYKALIGHRRTHPIFGWLWRAKCQIKLKVFFWLLLKDRVYKRSAQKEKNDTRFVHL